MVWMVPEVHISGPRGYFYTLYPIRPVSKGNPVNTSGTSTRLGGGSLFSLLLTLALPSGRERVDGRENGGSSPLGGNTILDCCALGHCP